MLSPSHHQHAAVGSPGLGARALDGTRDKSTSAAQPKPWWCRNDRAQTLRYPLVRVARVVSSTVVLTGSGAALALCLQHGIGISWVNARGEALGTCYPHLRQHPQFASALGSVAGNPRRPRALSALAACPAHGRADALGASASRHHQPRNMGGHQARLGLCTAVSPAPARRDTRPLAGLHWLPTGRTRRATLLWDAQSDAVDLDADLCELLGRNEPVHG